MASWPWPGFAQDPPAETASAEGSLPSVGQARRYKRRASAFAAEASFIVLHEDPATAARALDAAVAELRQVEEIFSLYRPDSALCRLNRDGVLTRPHAYLVKVLQKAMALSEKTSGAFDVTVQPLWELYASAKKAGHMPAAAEIKEAQRKVNWRKVEVTPDRIRLRGPGMAVTLNALAQGFAADRVMATLRMQGIQHALVNTGEIAALGHKEGNGPWTVGIQHPRRADAYLGLAELRDCGMATSGDYATRFSDDFVHHHIFDPTTGQSARELASVTVVAPSGLDADGLSTAIMVLGQERGLKLLRLFPGAKGFLVKKNDETVMTPDFPIT